LRKVFGSTSNRVRLRLIRTFLNYVLIAFVVSVPVVWYVAGEWISRYSYRITWWYWIPVAGIIVWLISFAAVVVQSYVASNENPVKHIKDNQ
ncbi:MAG: ABC transporter permease, partial [Prevotellaceae bacterium]|nr:ABC transporter permease [Prevotellaceae bacterium]